MLEDPVHQSSGTQSTLLGIYINFNNWSWDNLLYALGDVLLNNLFHVNIFLLVGDFDIFDDSQYNVFCCAINSERSKMTYKDYWSNILIWLFPLWDKHNLWKNGSWCMEHLNVHVIWTMSLSSDELWISVFFVVCIQ